MLTLAELRRFWYSKVHFLKLNIFVSLTTRFQVYSIILTSFRQGGVILPPTNTSTQTPKKPTQITPMKTPMTQKKYSTRQCNISTSLKSKDVPCMLFF